MKIERIENIPIVVPLKETFLGSYYSMSHRATLITKVYTDEGVVGLAYNGDEVETQHEISRIITDELFPLIEGRDPILVEQCWEAMLPPTFDILRNRRLVIQAISAVDSALWDIVGKVAGLPNFRLWGGYTDELPIVAIGGYQGKTDAELAAEVDWYLEAGIAGCKMKVGGRGLTPEEDARRFLVMRKSAGDDFILMADANQAYTVDEALRFVKLVEDHNLRWFEEPVHWYNDRRAMREVRVKSGIPVAAGQSEPSRMGALDLIEDGAVDVCNFDSSWSGGPTEWRKVAAVAQAHGVEMGHHEEPQIAAHLLASIPHGTYVEAFHPDRDPLFWNLIANRPEIKNGMYPIPSDPGWGLELDEAYVNKHRADKE